VQDLFINKVAANFKLQKKSRQYLVTLLNKAYFSLSNKELNAARIKKF
jgi:hypothetical protein